VASSAPTASTVSRLTMHNTPTSAMPRSPSTRRLRFCTRAALVLRCSGIRRLDAARAAGPFRQRLAQTAELVVQLVHQLVRFLLRADHARRDQHDQLGATIVIAGGTEQAADQRNLARERHAGTAARLAVADQAAERDRLAVVHG